MFEIPERCDGLFVTREFNLLVTCFAKKQVHEYSTNGDIIRKISLDESIDNPQHCIRLSTGQFVVSQDGITVNRVCLVSSSGGVLCTYGEPDNSNASKLYGPGRMAVDNRDNVLVADWTNAKVEVLSPTLKHLEYIELPPGRMTDGPCALHLDELNHRLYIVEWRTGKLYVVNVDFLKVKPTLRKDINSFTY